MSKKISIERTGNNIFATGLLRGAPNMHIVPSLTRDDLAVDKGKNLFLELGAETESGKEVRIINSFGRVFAEETVMPDETKELSIDPWKLVGLLPPEQPLTDNPGRIWRERGKVIVEVPNEPWCLDFDAVCINPDSPEEKRIYRKEFTKKKIYLPGEYDQAMSEWFGSPDTFISTMNGYSKITDEQCVRYGIAKGAYEQACIAILRKMVPHLRVKFTAAKQGMIYGASDTGVDWALELVAREFNIDLLGFSCPRFMLYVKDDDIPVFVGKDKDDYADYYIRSTHFLISTGGREHALQHDVLSACIYNRRIHFIDVLNSLSETGGVPATVSDGKGGFKIDNAAAAFGRNVSFFSRDDAIAATPPGGDIWDAIFQNVNSVATEVCRKKMSPLRKF